jgi:hypothetical protein
MKKKIAFFEYLLAERGTTVAVFDYAYYNIKLLGNESIVIHHDDSFHNKRKNVPSVVKKFHKHFKTFEINKFEEVDKILLDEKVDILYMLKYGDNDGKISKVCKTVVHAVFTAQHPHGDIYLPISPAVKGYDKINKFVPHMINLPSHDQDMREELGIPKDAIVFGRYGGFEKFDIQMTQRAVFRAACANKNIYFLFANTKKFCKERKNIIFLDMLVPDKDDELNFAGYQKVKFINSCDAMVWGRQGGECFGLAIGEFSSKNKPIIATKMCDDTAHVHFLGNKGIWYNSNKELFKILMTFRKDNTKNYDGYGQFTPENVMDIFGKEFIE